MSTFHYAEVLHYGQTAIGAYGLVQSLMAILKLREWEPHTKMAAKFSKTAEDQLHRTRTTQSSAFGTILASIVVSTSLAYSWRSTPHWARLLVGPSMAIMTKVVHSFVLDFWEGSKRVPMATGYNDAIRKTEETLRTLFWLQISWWVSAFLAGTVGYR